MSVGVDRMSLMTHPLMPVMRWISATLHPWSRNVRMCRRVFAEIMAGVLCPGIAGRSRHVRL